ncbi:unnamed protein product [Thlaspi arvense]|uniref:Sulfotransferase n=1 Tax=Thlaspi arvense TaxID=13288 RepID=A0AAU9T381_THLAR|nr:unnamed protein product [Thlaspi arvense]
MDTTKVSETITEGEEGMSKKYKELVLSLPCAKFWDHILYKYQGYWMPSRQLNGIISFQKYFKAQNSDIILCTFPKSGTTWLKALVYTTLNRSHCAPNSATHPLLACNPHNLVPYFEMQIYGDENENPNLENLPNPRIFATHLPFSLLPPSISYSNCRIVYICRNPLDQLISYWYFFTSPSPNYNETNSIEELVKMFEEGICMYGPFWDHVLEYWNKSIERKDRILFLYYEDLKEDIISQSIRLADFLGLPFSEEEKDKGVIEDISRLCSFRNLKELEVNKSEDLWPGVPNNIFFRKGEVGDWVNHLSPAMVEKIKKLVEEKFKDSGITFKMTSDVKMD